MTQNPEEGRFTEESKEKALRESRRVTVQMRRQLRAERNKKAAADKAGRWVMRHKASHTEADERMVEVSHGRKPLNRHGRRHFAKRMNAFKMPNGWKNFNEAYAARFGHMESVSRGNRARKDAAKAEKLAKKNNSIVNAIAKGDK